MMSFIEMIVQAIGELLSGEMLMKLFKKKEHKQRKSAEIEKP